MLRRTLPITFALAAAACTASAPPLPPPPSIPFEEKMAAIIRLEDRRLLRDPAPPVVPPPPPPSGKRAPVVVPPPPPPDLINLLSDSEARLRRRAALAVGRVGLLDGVEPLVSTLADPDPEVRHMAAFGLGLIGDRSAVPPLVAALDDISPIVQGGAAEALGLIGDASAAEPIGRLAAGIVESGALAEPPAADVDARRDVPASAFRLALYALVRLKAYEPLAAAVLDPSGQPRVRWWPVAYALQRIEDRRALGALLTLAREPDPYTRAFAAKGLGGLKDATAVPTLIELLGSGEMAVVVESVRALGRIGDAASTAAPMLLKMLQTKETSTHVRLEAVEALGAMKADGVYDFMLDSLADSNPAVRAAALRATALLDPQQFLVVLSGLDPDPVWSVRAAIASALATLPAETAVPALMRMLDDMDQRVVPALLQALIAVRAPMVTEVLLRHLTADDIAVRAAAAAGLGELKPPQAEQALAEAYEFGQRDSSFSARAAALGALAQYGAASATPVLRAALSDKDWAVRRRAAALLKQFEPAAAAEIDRLIRPAPTTLPAAIYESGALINPPVSTAVFLDTDRGTIEIELAMLDAPLTVENFVRLARMSHFDGVIIHRVVPDFVIQSGDPRGDGEGGPGYTIRDEVSERPYLRGTVGMALDAWGDTGGSQFFITHSPQPHLDGRYTVFGRVIAGMDVVDQIQQGDVIRRVRVWDGVTTSQNIR
jgi:HEAT repeat protein/cyclophilin family peptidyl-prolyl cis-trans isomerase